MKKILYSIFALTLVLPVMASAATFSFSPSTGSFAPGETFSVAVFVNPSAGEEITVAKLSSTFSAEGLEVVSFSQATGWMSLATPGSDLIDNTAGKLIKTGGFPARVTESKLFGTLALKAKSVGTATISVEGDSMMLDIANADKFVSTAGASFTIVEPTPTPPPAVAPATTPATAPTGVSGTVAPSTVTEEESTDETDTTTDTTEDLTTTPQDQTAAVAAAGDGASAKNLWYYFVATLVILIVAGGLYWRKKGSNNPLQ